MFPLNETTLVFFNVVQVHRGVLSANNYTALFFPVVSECLKHFSLNKEFEDYGVKTCRKYEILFIVVPGY